MVQWVWRLRIVYWALDGPRLQTADCSRPLSSEAGTGGKDWPWSAPAENPPRWLGLDGLGAHPLLGHHGLCGQGAEGGW